MERVLVLDKNQQLLIACGTNRAILPIEPVKKVIFRRYLSLFILNDLISFRLVNKGLKPLVEKLKLPSLSLQGKGVREILYSSPKIKRLKQVIKNGTIYQNNPPIEKSVIVSFPNKISNLASINLICQESVHFASKLMQNAELRRIDYKQWELFRRLKYNKLPVKRNRCGLIKFNLCRQKLEKSHWLDAGYVGKSPPVKPQITGIKPLLTERTAIAMLPKSCPRQLYHFGRPQYQTAFPIPATAKLRKAMVDVSMGEER